MSDTCLQVERWGAIVIQTCTETGLVGGRPDPHSPAARAWNAKHTAAHLKLSEPERSSDSLFLSEAPRRFKVTAILTRHLFTRRTA